MVSGVSGPSIAFVSVVSLAEPAEEEGGGDHSSCK
jgi:hypothetical protein